MKKYVVVKCDERNLSALAICNSLREAQRLMKADLNLLLNERAEIDIKDCDERDNEWGLEELSAWSNYDSNVDWKIIEVS